MILSQICQIFIFPGINRLATSESNKDRLVHRGALKVYTRLLHPSCSEEEQLLATQGIWVMAFNQENKKRIREEPGCVEGKHTIKWQTSFAYGGIDEISANSILYI